MALSSYDPNAAPDPQEWLALDEGERIMLCEDHHRSPSCDHPLAPNPQLHAAIHNIVENQIALGDETPVAENVDRLVRDGLSRHDAVHAIGTDSFRDYPPEGTQYVGVTSRSGLPTIYNLAGIVDAILLSAGTIRGTLTGDHHFAVDFISICTAAAAHVLDRLQILSCLNLIKSSLPADNHGCISRT